MQRFRRLALVVVPALVLGVGCCSDGTQDAPETVSRFAVEFPIRGAWLAPRATAGLASASARDELDGMRDDGVRWVAIGHDVVMPRIDRPGLEWGSGDAELRSVLRAIEAAGMEAFLLPRIESPDFFEPPYPFRADIAFDTADDWERFHADVERMLVHYARLADQEEVALFGIGLELKRSVKGFGPRWRRIIERVRSEFGGAITYSANWYDEWRDVPFWDALDYVGIGAYFELDPVDPVDSFDHPIADVAARWRPIARELADLSARVGKPVLFSEVGYTGYRDCVERPWEWAGKQERGVPIDHERQAVAYAGMFRALGDAPWLAGTFLWTYYAGPTDIEDWEYAIQGRPARRVVRQAYR